MPEWLALTAAIAGALLVIGIVVNRVWKEIKDAWDKLKEVLESYLGRPATKYYPAEPSIPERMVTSEELLLQLNKQADTNERRLYTIETYLFPSAAEEK